MNTNTMNTNMNELNLKELNLDEMERINGGWNWKDALATIVPTTVLGAAAGGLIASWPGALVGAGVGAGIGVAVLYM